MKHTFIILAIFLVILCLGASLWLRLPFCSIGLTLLLLLLFFLEQRHLRLFIRLRDESAEIIARLRMDKVDSERHLHLYKELLKDTETGIILATPNGHIQWNNKKAQILIGLKQDKIPAYLMEAISQNREQIGNLAISCTNIQMEGCPRIIVVLKEIRQQLVHLQIEAWQQLIRLIVHETRNSIAPIISVCQQIQSPPNPLSTDEINTSINLVERRSRSLMKFIENCRLFSNLSQPSKKPFHVTELFTDLQTLYPFCHFEVTPTDLVFTADRIQIEQVLINLIKNAQEAHATFIELKASDQTISVRDNGQGIPPATLDDIFKPFYTTKSQGTGIGLSLSRQIILQHGGQLTVDSKEGKGTTFCIKL